MPPTLSSTGTFGSTVCKTARTMSPPKFFSSVVVMMFSEFGRRVPENVNLGTDHGTANLMFVAGTKVKGGLYGTVPSLTKLDKGDNLIYTTDFRRVYATMISGWLGHSDTKELLRGDFEPFGMFQRA